MSNLHRPAGITAICIIFWVIGGLGVLGTPFTLLSVIAPESLPGGQFNPMVEVFYHHPGIKTFTLISAVLGLLVTLAGLAGSIGLWLGRAWGWTLSIGYSAYTILAVVVGLGFNILVLFPAMNEATRSMGSAAASSAIGGYVGGICGSLFGLALPIALLIVIFRPASKAWRDQRPFPPNAAPGQPLPPV